MAGTSLTYQQAWLEAKIARCMCPVLAPSAPSIRTAVKIASAGLYGVSLADGSARTAYSANVAGSNCIGPSAPERFLPGTSSLTAARRSNAHGSYARYQLSVVIDYRE